VHRHVLRVVLDPVRRILGHQKHDQVARNDETIVFQVVVVFPVQGKLDDAVFHDLLGRGFQLEADLGKAVFRGSRHDAIDIEVDALVVDPHVSGVQTGLRCHRMNVSDVELLFSIAHEHRTPALAPFGP